MVVRDNKIRSSLNNSYGHIRGKYVGGGRLGDCDGFGVGGMRSDGGFGGSGANAVIIVAGSLQERCEVKIVGL